MFIQSINNTNFGKIGYNGGKAMGRGHKPRNLLPGSGSKLDKGYKSQIKQSYNSLDKSQIFDNLNDICDSFMEKTVSMKKKFLSKK